MQDNWFEFFAIQRYTQLMTPYLYQFCVEAAIVGMTAIGFTFLWVEL